MRDLEFLDPFGSVPFTIAPDVEIFQDFLKQPETMKLVTNTGFFSRKEKEAYEGHAIILINSQCVPEKTSEIPYKSKLEETLDAVGVKLSLGSGVILERKTENADMFHGTNALADHVEKYGNEGATLKEGNRTIDVSTTGKYGLSKLKQMELVGWGIYPALVYDPKSKALWLRDYQSVPFVDEYKPRWPLSLRFKH